MENEEKDPETVGILGRLF